MRGVPQGLASFALLLVACAGRWSPPLPSAAENPDEARVLIVKGKTGCQAGQADIGSWVDAGAARATESFRALGWAGVTEVPPERSALLAELARPRREPLIVMYLGHGGLVQPGEPSADPLKDAHWVERCREERGRCYSVSCTEKPVTVDALVEAVPAQVPWALFLLDACTSAHVDVRGAKTRVAVVSVSPFPVDANEMLLSTGLSRLRADELDADCDGTITDLELFAALNHQLPEGGEGGGSLAIPKLRRQSRAPIPLRAAPLHGSCQQRPSSAPMVATLDLYKTLEPLGRHEPLRWNGQRVAADALQVAPCPDEVGQCFRKWTP